MEKLIGTHREITVRLWQEQVDKYRERLAQSEEVMRRFGECEWLEEDRQKVLEVETGMRKAIEYMDRHGIK